jgi:hypothetical protein
VCWCWWCVALPDTTIALCVCREEADKVVTLLSTDGEGGPGFGKPGEAITFEFVQRIVEELARSH